MPAGVGGNLLTDLILWKGAVYMAAPFSMFFNQSLSGLFLRVQSSDI